MILYNYIIKLNPSFLNYEKKQRGYNILDEKNEIILKIFFIPNRNGDREFTKKIYLVNPSNKLIDKYKVTSYRIWKENDKSYQYNVSNKNPLEESRQLLRDFIRENN